MILTLGFILSFDKPTTDQGIIGIEVSLLFIENMRSCETRYFRKYWEISQYILEVYFHVLNF